MARQVLVQEKIDFAVNGDNSQPVELAERNSRIPRCTNNLANATCLSTRVQHQIPMGMAWEAK